MRVPVTLVSVVIDAKSALVREQTQAWVAAHSGTLEVPPLPEPDNEAIVKRAEAQRALEQSIVHPNKTGAAQGEKTPAQKAAYAAARQAGASSKEATRIADETR